ncbi:MAG: hypothetical protein QW587_09425 [Candidatus Bathyarchaeia archaeon]
MGQKVHLPNFLKLESCEVVALCETREKLGKAVAEKHGAPRYYRSHEDLARRRHRRHRGYNRRRAAHSHSHRPPKVGEARLCREADGAETQGCRADGPSSETRG